MKKYVLKATALAIGALVGGSAFAAITSTIDLDANTGAQTYAKELTYAALTGGANKLNTTNQLGFGVSTGQTRYIRFDLTNAKFTASSLAAAPVIGTDIDVGGGGISGASLVQGGGVGQAFAVYQITAGSDLSASAAVKLKIAELNVTATTASVQIKYSLHETATSAQGTTASNTALLSSVSADAAQFSTGLQYTVDSTPTTTADVETSFKKFKTGGGYVAIDQAKIGTLTVDKTAVKKGDGTAVAFADLVAAGTKIVLTGDFSIRAGANDAAKKTSVYLDSDGDCSTGSGSQINSNTVPSGTGAEFVINTTAQAGAAVCYVVDGTSQIPSAGPYKAQVVVVAAASTTSASFGDKALGSIDRDGTELTAPFTTINPDYISRIVLTSSHTGDPASVVVTPILANGGSCGAGNSNFSLIAGKQLFINAIEVCPSISGLVAGTDTRLGFKITVAAPKAKIEGVMNILKKGTATTSSSDLNSYTLSRPAN